MARQLTYAEALVEALTIALERDERIQLIGASFLGLNRNMALLQPLTEKFADRIIYPPIAELASCGMGTGAAMAGLRSIVDLTTASFVFQAFPQIANEAANGCYMTNGRIHVPVIFHLLHGLRGGGGAQHSHSPQAMLWNTPGLQIMLPSSPADVLGLLLHACSSDNPTVWLDHGLLLDMTGPVPDSPAPIPFGQAEVKRAGKDVTVVATSLMVQRSLGVAEELAKEGIDVELVDPRTLVPLDKEAILKSVGKTGRLVVVDECHKSCGVAAELLSLVVEEGWDLLRRPPKRVATADVPVPFSPALEQEISPTAEKIRQAIRSVL